MKPSLHLVSHGLCKPRLISPMIGPIYSIEFHMTSNTKHLAQLQYGASQYNYCLGARSNASS